MRGFPVHTVRRIAGLAFAGALVLALAQCAQRTTTPADQFNGEELYRGVFYGYGPAAQRLPELDAPAYRRGLERHRETLERQIAASLEHIRSTEPGLLEEFAEDMQSGDPQRVEAAINEIAPLAVEGMQAEGLAPRDIPAEETRLSTRGWNWYCVLIWPRVYITPGPIILDQIDGSEIGRLELTLYKPREELVAYTTEQLASR